MALGDRIYEDATEIYFHRRQINTARFGWALPLSLPGLRFHQRSLGLFGASVGALINASR